VAAAGEGGAAPARGRRRGATDGETQPRARGARRLRVADGGGQQTRSGSCGRGKRGAFAAPTAAGSRRAAVAAGEESAAPARERRRGATDGETQTRARGARRLRRADGGGQQVGRRSLGRLGLPGEGRPSALAHSPDFGARTERMTMGERQ